MYPFMYILEVQCTNLRLGGVWAPPPMGADGARPVGGRDAAGSWLAGPAPNQGGWAHRGWGRPVGRITGSWVPAQSGPLAGCSVHHRDQSFESS